MATHALIRWFNLLIFLSFHISAIAEIHLNEHVLLTSFGIQLPLVHAELNNNVDEYTNFALGSQTQHLTDDDFKPTRFDNQQLTAIYDYYLTSKLRYSEHLSLLINTNIQVNQYQYSHSSFKNQNIDEYRASPSASFAFALENSLLIGTAYQNNVHLFNTQLLSPTQELFISWLPNKDLVLSGSYMDINNTNSQSYWYVSGVIHY